ncbi:unnamed protein product, partial [Cylindrotheca closterium]
FDRLQ